MKRALIAAAVAVVALAVPASASAAWGGVSFDNRTIANDQNASCGEAGIYTAGFINDTYGATAVNGGTKHNCPGPHPNASAKFERWTNAAGTITWECLYDEDAGSNVDLSCSQYSGFRAGNLPFTSIVYNGTIDGVLSCGQANLWAAGTITDIWGSNAISGGYTGNCAGPHPSSSAKWSQWGGPGGNVFYDCLADEDAPDTLTVECRGPSGEGRYPTSPVR